MTLSATCKVSIAFADGPLVVSPTWTDVTAWVRSVRTNRGRSTELDDFQAGTAVVVLENVDRRFDPDYTSGAYHPNVKVRRQIKIEGVYSAVTYPIFRGVVQSWGQDWPTHNRDATCTVQAVDLFGLLATWDLPDTAHELYAKTLAQSAWWSLDDDDTTMRDRVGSADGTYRAERDQADALVYRGDGASEFTAVAGTPSMVTWSYPGTSTQTVLSIVAKVQSSGATLIGLTAPSASGTSFFITVNTSGAVTAAFNINFDQAFVDSGISVDYSAAHHYVAIRNGVDVDLYLDGVLVGTASDAGMTGASGPLTGYVNGGGLQTGTVMDEAMLWHGSTITATQIGLLASAALTGWAGQSADARLTRLLDILGVPSGLYSTTAASSNVGGFVGGTDALSYFQTVARSDQGRLFVTRAGVILFQPKTVDMGASTVATFADDSTANSVKYSGFGLDYDDRLIYNEVTVSGVDVEAAAVNDTSIGTYSRRGLAIRTALPTASACEDVAQATVARFADPQTRGKGWVVHPERALNGSSTKGWATVLGRELGDLVSLKRTPPVGTALTKTVSVTSIGHDINIPEGKWDVSMTGAPAYTTASFRWGTSNWGGSDNWS